MKLQKKECPFMKVKKKSSNCPFICGLNKVLGKKALEILIGMALLVLFPVIIFKLSTKIYKVGNRLCFCRNCRRG